ncbi:MAG: hypothetical protein VX871_01580 [Pseudomonadota bacterium]|nr:hypothetical protein [Pseudomonadota bacterium]
MNRILGIALAAAAFATVGAATVSAHPHDALAMCQLPGGKWVHCDDTIHDAITNEHVAKNGPIGPGNFKAPGKPKRQQLRIVK